MTSRLSGFPQVSVIVPVFNGADTLQALCEQVTQVMQARGATFEIVLVHDGGTDESWSVAAALAQQDDRIVAIQLMRNYGQGAATLCGLRHARGEFLVTIDDDLQNPPSEINVLIDALVARPDLDAVIGVPVEKRHALWRRLGSWGINRLSSGYIFEMPDRDLKLTSFRIMRRAIVNPLLSITTPSPAPGAMLCAITPRIRNVPVRHAPRPQGRGGYTPSKLLGLTLDKTLSFSTLPLRALASIGLLGIASTVVLGGVYLTRYLSGGVQVPGWTTQVLLIIGVAGFNFFAFGVVGEYLLRILQTVQGQPPYRIRQSLGTGYAARSSPEVTARAEQS